VNQVRLFFALVVIAFGYGAMAVEAQVTTATIYGTVVDPSGAAVPGAGVTATSEQTGTAVHATSGPSGEVSLPPLPVGRYTIRVEAQGFKTEDRTGVELTAGEKVSLTFTLALGATSDTVAVTAEAPMLTTTTAQQESEVSSLQVRELPLVRRDWTNLLTLTPGMALASSAGGSAGVSLNGLPPASMHLTLDGGDSEADEEAPGLSMYGNFNFIKSVSVEAIDEVNVAKGIASADIANTMSGNVNIITKSGSNSIHGSLFENFQSSDTNARNQFLTSKALVVFNQFGGSLGGPVIKNKVFFFFAYEGYRQVAFTPVSGNVPTAEFKALAIAAQPSYKPFLDEFPLPTSPYAPGAITGVYSAAGRGGADDDHTDFRMDYHLTDSNLITGRYSQGFPFKLTPSAQVVNYQTQTGKTEEGTISWLHLRSNWSSETRFTFDQPNLVRVNNEYNLGVPDISGNLGFGTAESGSLFYKGGDTATLEHNFVRRIGRHNLKFGGLVVHRDMARANPEQPDTQFANVADFLADRMSLAAIDWGVTSELARTLQFGGFIQDDFKVNSRLTMNLGIRYDYQTVPIEVHGNFYSRGQPFGFGPVQPEGSLYNADYTGFGPRFGFAYVLDQKGKTVLRGGAAILTNPRPGFDNFLEVAQNGLYQPRRYRFSAAEVQQYGLLYAGLSNASTLPIVLNNPNFPWGQDAINPHFPNPKSYNWNLGIQRELTQNLVLDIAYVGTRGIHSNYGTENNQVNPLTGQYPIAGFGAFRYYTADGSSEYHALQAALRKRFSQNFQFNVSYTYASDNAVGPGDFVASSSAQDTQGTGAINMTRKDDVGPPLYAAKSVFVSNFLYELPLGRLFKSNSRGSQLALRGWQFSGIFTGSTGLPFQILQSSTLVNSRPDYIGGDPILSNYSSTLQYLNPAAFAKVPVAAISGATIRAGTVGRDDVRGPGMWNVDAALSKNFIISESVRLQIRSDMFNALNHTNLTGVSANITSGNFGRLTAATARTVQFNARLTF